MHASQAAPEKFPLPFVFPYLTLTHPTMLITAPEIVANNTLSPIRSLLIATVVKKKIDTYKTLAK